MSGVAETCSRGCQGAMAHAPQGGDLSDTITSSLILPFSPNLPYFLAFQPLKMGFTSLPFPFPQSHFQIVLKKIQFFQIFFSFAFSHHAYSIFYSRIFTFPKAPYLSQFSPPLTS